MADLDEALVRIQLEPGTPEVRAQFEEFWRRVNGFAVARQLEDQYQEDAGSQQMQSEMEELYEHIEQAMIQALERLERPLPDD